VTFDPFWGPFLYLGFSFVGFFYLYSLMISIFLFGLNDISRKPLPPNESALLWALIDQVKQWLGIRQKPEEMECLTTVAGAPERKPGEPPHRKGATRDDGKPVNPVIQVDEVYGGVVAAAVAVPGSIRNLEEHLESTSASEGLRTNQTRAVIEHNFERKLDNK